VDRSRGAVALRQDRLFNGKALPRARKGGISGNHFDVETGEEYRVSGVKKDGTDRHWAGAGKVASEASAVANYLALR
jgi:hypothetical protein